MPRTRRLYFVVRQLVVATWPKISAGRRQYSPNCPSDPSRWRLLAVRSSRRVPVRRPTLPADREFACATGCSRDSWGKRLSPLGSFLRPYRGQCSKFARTCLGLDVRLVSDMISCFICLKWRSFLKRFGIRRLTFHSRTSRRSYPMRDIQTSGRKGVMSTFESHMRRF